MSKKYREKVVHDQPLNLNKTFILSSPLEAIIFMRWDGGTPA
jgi:hypothetical protein